jgi:hypothetical protein
MNNRSGKVTRSPCSRAGNAVARLAQFSSDRSSLPDTDASFPVLSDASDPTGPMYRARHEHVAGRSAADDWRIALHEAGHVVSHLVQGDEVSGATIVPDGECDGKTWGPQGAHAAAVWNADSIFDFGVSREGEPQSLFACARAAVIGLMGGCAAEMSFLGDSPPRYIGSDVPSANRIAGFVCRTTASVAAFVEHGYQESLALVEQHKTAVQAIAQALIDHPKRTLIGAEIDAVIAPLLAAEAAADERERRADWRCVEQNASGFSKRAHDLR